MDLSKITIELEQLSNSEAIQHGFNVGRVYYFYLLQAMLIAIIPVVVLLVLLYLFVPKCHHLGIMVIIFWWFQPYYERVMVLVLSRLVFGEKVSFKLYSQQLIPAMKNGTWLRLSFWRLAFVRSFHAPIELLEQLKGKRKKNRFVILNTRAHSSALLLSLSFGLLAIIIGMNFSVLLSWFVPDAYFEMVTNNLIQDEQLEDFFTVVGLPLILGNLILTPFYVSCGFLLYLHQRVSLEGWDIEIKFRQIAERLEPKETLTSVKTKSSILASILLIFVALASYSSPVFATTAQNKIDDKTVSQEVSKKLEMPQKSQTMAETNKDILNRISHDEKIYPFEVKKKWFYVGKKIKKKEQEKKKKRKNQWNMNALAFFFKWLVIFSFIVGIVFLLLRYGRYLSWFFPQKEETVETPKVLFGLDIRKEALPDNILDAVREAIEKAQYRKALSLLYRASLIDLIHHDKLKIKESYTEGDCTALVTKFCRQNKANFFKGLTNTWLNTAYANQEPTKTLLEHYVQEWPQYFGENQKETGNDIGEKQGGSDGI